METLSGNRAWSTPQVGVAVLIRAITYEEADIIMAYNIIEESVGGQKMCAYMFARKILTKRLISPKLCKLPPTSHAFKLHCQQAYCQTALWKGEGGNDASPNCDPRQCGWCAFLFRHCRYEFIELASAKHMAQAMNTVLRVHFSDGRPKGLIKYGKGFDNDFTY